MTIDLHTGAIRVGTVYAMTATLVWETRVHAYGIRVWPRGETQKMLDFGVITTSTQQRQVWKGEACKALTAAHKLLMPQMLTYVKHPSDADLRTLKDAVRAWNQHYAALHNAAS